MCLWLITACLGLLPSNPIVVVPGVPTPILTPTTVSTVSTAFPTFPTFQTVPTAFPTVPTAFPTVPTAFPTVPTAFPTNPGNTTAAPTTSVPPNTSNTSPPTTISTTNPTTSANSPTTGGVLLPLILCDNPVVVCISNPDENNTGPLPIDPRVGTTQASLAALQAQYQPSDSSVRFPREKRDVSTDRRQQNISLQIGHIIRKRQSCACVPAGTCNTGTNYGAGMIDIRIVTPGAGQCPAGQVYCCVGTTGGGGTQTVVACGVRQAVPATAVTPAEGQASFGEFPWQAIIMTRQNDYIAGGVLVDQMHVLTVTHRILPYIVSGTTAPNVKVRLGEWDAAGTYEPLPFQEYNVQKVFSHPSYVANTLQYDITVLRLTPPVPLTPMAGSAASINRACLPAATSSFVGQRCWVSGWGKNMFGVQGQYQQILKKVDVPVVAPATCQTQLQTARLGSTYVLDTTSFVCAGGEVNKDACTGDGGSGLVCQVNNQWTVVGLVAWGLGCANPSVPGVYVNIAALLPWIQQQIATP